MATIKQGILGGFSGKVGGVVGSSWKGIAVMKAKPLSVANPKTAGQVAQRTKLSYVSQFASIINASVIKPLWDRFASQESGYNAFVRTNIDLFAAALPSVPASLVISSGAMAATAINAITPAAGGSSTGPTWTDDSGSGYKLSSDVPYVVAVNATTGEVQVQAETVTRLSEICECVFDTPFVSGDVINVYLAFKRADGTIVSNTSFITATVA